MKPAVANFTFPLNVYASILEKEEGRVDFLHYGLFGTPEDSALQAQRNASRLLFDHLPQPPCRILEVGIGLAVTMTELVQYGYEVTGITPDAAQIAFARDRHGGALAAMECIRYEDFNAEPGSWQAILFQESAQYIDDIDIFDRADRLLCDGGEIIVMDEFLMRRDRPGRERLHSLDYFLRLAERAGFSIVTQIDLSAQAAPTLDWLLNGVARHAGALKAELGVSEAQLDALDASNRDYRAKYAAGHYGYFLIRLRRKERPRWRMGRISGERSAEMRALFAEVFGHEMSAAHWQWKYGGGRGLGIGVWSEQEDVQSGGRARRLVAHYGGTSREIMYFGQRASAFQACDLMVSSSERGTLTRKGPAFLVVSTYLEHELGYGAPHILGIGFPNERAYRVPERLGLYAGSLARIQEVAWPARQSRPSLSITLREQSPDDPACDAHINACWEAMRASLGEYIVGLRDADYIRHRYLKHPDKSYRLFILKRRFGGEPLGLLVLRLTENEAAGERRCELLDVVTALPRVPLLVNHARRIAAQWGCTSLFAWLADNMLPCFSLAENAVVHDLGVLVPGNNWTDGPPMASVAGRWWLTGGDTDFH